MQKKHTSRKKDRGGQVAIVGLGSSGASSVVGQYSEETAYAYDGIYIKELCVLLILLAVQNTNRAAVQLMPSE